MASHKRKKKLPSSRRASRSPIVSVRYVPVKAAPAEQQRCLRGLGGLLWEVATEVAARVGQKQISTPRVTSRRRKTK